MSGTTPKFGAPRLVRTLRIEDGAWLAQYEWVLPADVQAPLYIGDPDTREAVLGVACAEAIERAAYLATKLSAAETRGVEVSDRLRQVLQTGEALAEEKKQLINNAGELLHKLGQAEQETKRHKALAERMQRDAELGDIAMPPSHFNPMGQLTWAERERALVAQVRGLEAKVAYLEAKHGKA